MPFPSGIQITLGSLGTPETTADAFFPIALGHGAPVRIIGEMTRDVAKHPRHRNAPQRSRRGYTGSRTRL